MQIIAWLAMLFAGLLGHDGCVEDEFKAVTDAGIVCVHIEGDGYRWID